MSKAAPIGGTKLATFEPRRRAEILAPFKDGSPLERPVVEELVKHADKAGFWKGFAIGGVAIGALCVIATIRVTTSLLGPTADVTLQGVAMGQAKADYQKDEPSDTQRNSLRPNGVN